MLSLSLLTATPFFALVPISMMAAAGSSIASWRASASWTMATCFSSSAFVAAAVAEEEASMLAGGAGDGTARDDEDGDDGGCAGSGASRRALRTLSCDEREGAGARGWPRAGDGSEEKKKRKTTIPATSHR